MEVVIHVINQQLKLATNLENLVDGSQKFVRFKFEFKDDWSGLTTFAQFTQNGNSYNQYLDNENSVFLPAEIDVGECTLMLYGTGDETIGTTNYLTLNIDDNILVTDADSTEITQSLYQQLVAIVQGMSDDMDQAKSDAMDALTTAASAQNTANAALSEAGDAVDIIQSAITAAELAQSKADFATLVANGADTKAQNAISSASAAQSAADAAQTSADLADTRAQQALTNAAAAQSAASTAQSSATQAIQDASTAQSSANAAQTSATSAAALAQSASDSAVLARSEAAAASTAAANANTSANQALQSATSAATAANTAQASASQAILDASAASSAANNAQLSASDALGAANAAQSSANQALSSAATAAAAAGSAQASADNAEESAIRANASADNALTQLSIVEDVAGTLAWIQEHGSYVLTEDTEVTDGVIYFEYDSESGDYSPIISPDSDADPSENGWYVLDISDSQTEFIMAHLAVTSRGLWVLPSGLTTTDQTIDNDQDAASQSDTTAQKQANANARKSSNYKVLLASDGMYLYDGTGTMVVKYGASIDLGSGRPFSIGSNNAYILYYDSNNDGVADSMRIGGAVSIGGGMTLNEVLAELDSKLDSVDAVAFRGTSDTTATTAAKEVTCQNFTLAAGVVVTVLFTAANTSAGALTLDVNSTGAKDVWVSGIITSSTNQLLWAADAQISFVYDGTQWRVTGEPRSWQGSCSIASSTASKTADIADVVICKGTVLNLNMTYENTASSPTLNITSLGAKNLYSGTGTTRPTTDNGLGWTSLSTVQFVFDGQYWRTNGMSDAGARAVKYLTDLSNGVYVHSADTSTDPTESTAKGVKIADSIDIIRNGASVANYGDNIRIGKNNSPHVLVDNNGMGVIISGLEFARFSNTIKLGHANYSAQALFSSSGLHFKNLQDEDIAVIESNATPLDPEPTSIVANAYPESSPAISTSSANAFGPSALELYNVVYESPYTIEATLHHEGFAFVSADDSILNPSETWYHIKNSASSSVFTVTDLSTLSQDYYGTRTDVDYTVLLTAPTTSNTITKTGILVQNDIVNGVRTETEVGNVTVTLTTTFNSSDNKVRVTLTVSGIPSAVYEGEYKVKRHCSTKGENIGWTHIACEYERISGYDPEYIFGLKTTGKDSQSYAFLTGKNVYANASHQLIAGHFNNPDSNDAFEIGNGTSDQNRSNAFSVGWDGKVNCDSVSSSSLTTNSLNANNGNLLGVPMERFFHPVSPGNYASAAALPMNTVVRLSNATQASRWSDIPVQQAQVIMTFGTYANRCVQISIRNSTNMWVRGSGSSGYNPWREISLQTLTTSWESVTAASGWTISSGGYFQEGKHVYVYVRFRGSAGTAGTTYTPISGFPSPAVTTPSLSMMIANALNGIAWIDSGSLKLKPTSNFDSTNFIVINGHYISA